ncbi:MAG TPA: protein kinase [Longimicrobiales bacterium]|nr:protein kinase [Longimicrobiales bacterium]
MARLRAALEGRYRIDREIGVGGMATVYLAQDLRHNRRVALKVLKPELAAVVGSERFLAEIETTANLQHPHILPLFDSGEADGFLFFVMPYIEGETLREKIDREKQLPVDEAVGIATAVASALSVAHEQGVIHRDIKPANILLSRGEPLVTDFGIAIAVTNSSGARLTETGLSVGTPYYMSPEQATGDREITAASDVYALGCVLYEMLVGEPPYVGSTAQAVLGKILTEKPRHPTAVRATVPANVEGAVLQALEKLPADRFRSASGFVRAITDTSFRYGEGSAEGTQTASAPGPWKRATLALAGLSVILLGATLWPALGSRRAPGPTPVVLELSVPAEVGTVRDVAVSKDGTMFAIRGSAAPNLLWIRRIDEADFRPVPGTEGAGEMDFSPDGQWLAFYNLSRRALLKIPVSGGGAVPILEVDSISPDDMHWGEDGTIVFVSGGGTWGISDTGEGGARLLAGGVGIDPQMLPDGSGALADRDGAIHVIDFASDSVRRLVEGSGPKYLSTGHILYSGPATGSLFVVPFDLRRHEVTGPPVPVLDGYGGEDADDYSVSSNGTLVYLQGAARALNIEQGERQLVFRDRSGRPDTVPFTPRPLGGVAISPDGRFVAYEAREAANSPGTRKIQILDLLTGGTPEVASEGFNGRPVWSPDGTRLAIAHAEVGTRETDVFVLRVGAASDAERVLARPGTQGPVAWPDDELLVLEDLSAGNIDLVLLSLVDSGQVRPYLQANYSERELHLSPDGSLAAYESDETGITEIYVRGFPEPVGKRRISVGGGRDARWSADGDELYFWRFVQNGPDSLFAVPLQREPDFVPGEPELLFVVDAFARGWDVHPDGRFLMVQDVNNEWVGEPRYLVVLNWFTELEERLGR